MENATKALLIAAAVLVAVMLITLTLNVFQQGQNAVSNADMSDAEMQAFNTKFTTFEGTNRSTGDVNSLLNTVLTNNQKSDNDVTVSVDGTEKINATTNSFDNLSGSSRYTITCTMTNGMVSSITVKTNK